MTLKSWLLPAVLTMALGALGQQPASPAPPPAGSPPPPPGTTASPNSDQAAQPPDAPAPPPSPDAGQNSSTPAEPSQSSTSAGEPQNAEAAENSGRPLTSDEVRSQIGKKLRGEPALSSRNIRVEATADSVVLSGTVPTSNQRLLAERIARSYAGKRSVTNNLTVETGAPGQNGQPQQATPPESQGEQNPPPR